MKWYGTGVLFCKWIKQQTIEKECFGWNLQRDYKGSGVRTEDSVSAIVVLRTHNRLPFSEIQPRCASTNLPFKWTYFEHSSDQNKTRSWKGFFGLHNGTQSAVFTLAVDISFSQNMPCITWRNCKKLFVYGIHKLLQLKAQEHYQPK